MRADGRYQIKDEPRRLPLAGAGTSLLVLLPITIWLALIYSPLFFLLPGLLGFLVGGPHRWSAPGLALLSLVLFIALGIFNSFLLDWGVAQIWFDYAQDLRIAITVAPLFALIIGLQRTLSLAEAARL